jgi:murein L,D-transpeptidase YafK
MVMIASPKRCRGTLLSAVLSVLVVPGLVGAQAAVNAIPDSRDMEALGRRQVTKFASMPGPLGVAVASPAASEVRPASVTHASRESRTGFRDVQLRYVRVRRAHSSHADRVEARFQAQGVRQPAEVFFRVFKREQLLEVWARDADAVSFVMINTYPVCGTSGDLGPKREEGDAQIPEGFYSIDLFNPISNYHLSLRVDYPNAVDRARQPTHDLGGDIFIHGGCSTVGCVPVTDQWMEEIYLMAVNARDAGQERIPVHLFPTHLDEDGMEWLREEYGEDHPDLEFWESLRAGYEAFEDTRVVPVVAHQDGRYVVPVDLGVLVDSI